MKSLANATPPGDSKYPHWWSQQEQEIAQFKTRLRFLDESDPALEISRSTATGSVCANTDQDTCRVIKISRSDWMNKEPPILSAPNRRKATEPRRTRRFFIKEFPSPSTTTEAATNLQDPKAEKRLKQPGQMKISIRRQRSSLKRRFPPEEKIGDEGLVAEAQDEYCHRLHFADRSGNTADHRVNETSTAPGNRKVTSSSRSTSHGEDSWPLKATRHVAIPDFQPTGKQPSCGESSINSISSQYSEDLPISEADDLLLTTVCGPNNHPSHASHHSPPPPPVPTSHPRKIHPTQTPTPSLPQPVSAIRECVEKESVI
ncbi:unnamed protein product [Dibothriocephalus latus]|uniref:Uncharacterized protein n=1 Tax=Dibothriocephalus latus TaxID=60516 RepID=A0A3P7LEH2_DIBLA|nr:unnamed protein product [Dibothriocephalus latus]